MTSFFPDINVWIAMLASRHTDHKRAEHWFGSQPEARFYFCRLTQIGVLRLLCNATVMGDDAITQQQAWKVYDLARKDPRVRFMAEEVPEEVERQFRLESSAPHAIHRDWPDSYLLAFAAANGLRLVTFDRKLALRARTSGVLLAG